MILAPAVRTPIAIALGAIAGALSRYYLGLWLNSWLGTTFPYSTLIINLTGCFGMGVLATLFLHFLHSDRQIHPDIHILLTTGFLGSYTTFSSYTLETATLLQQHLGSALLYWVGSAGLGLLSLSLGMVLTKRVLQSCFAVLFK